MNDHSFTPFGIFALIAFVSGLRYIMDQGQLGQKVALTQSLRILAVGILFSFVLLIVPDEHTFFVILSAVGIMLTLKNLWQLSFGYSAEPRRLLDLGRIEKLQLVLIIFCALFALLCAYWASTERDYNWP